MKKAKGKYGVKKPHIRFSFYFNKWAVIYKNCEYLGLGETVKGAYDDYLLIDKLNKSK